MVIIRIWPILAFDLMLAPVDPCSIIALSLQGGRGRFWVVEADLSGGIKFLKSRRGKIIMMVNTFPFCEESKLRDKVIWRCTSKKTNCKARIHMLGSSVVAVKGMHNHPPRAPAPCLPTRRSSARKHLDAPPPPQQMLPVASMDPLTL
ncbi:unnamed protein product [Diatraea saccharalis]|uniref:FLYWCH-type domain-containing protein n=1 Tax=Diatraea saccharalis TaxID=40085 RepID=A0A9N9R110_9NEOP|nr:unnamed protein product [Diatraea saccharalis]